MKYLFIVLIFLASCSPAIQKIYHVQEYRAIRIKPKHHKRLKEITGKPSAYWKQYPGAYWVYSATDSGRVMEATHLKSEFVKKYKK